MRSSGNYEIPDHLSTIVDFVAGLHGFPFSNWKPKIYNANEGPRVAGNTPSTLYALYNVDLPTSACTNCNTTQAVVEFSSANYSPSDLQTFFNKYSPTLAGQTVGNVFIGQNNPNGIISVEANLDVQVSLFLSSSLPFPSSPSHSYSLSFPLSSPFSTSWPLVDSLKLRTMLNQLAPMCWIHSLTTLILLETKPTHL